MGDRSRNSAEIVHTRRVVVERLNGCERTVPIRETVLQNRVLGLLSCERLNQARDGTSEFIGDNTLEIARFAIEPQNAERMVEARSW